MRASIRKWRQRAEQYQNVRQRHGKAAADQYISQFRKAKKYIDLGSANK